MIYGNLDTDQGTIGFIPEFYVAQFSGQADEIVGEHQLGTPIEVETPIDITDPVTGLALNDQLAMRTQVLVQFTVGLMYDLAGLPQRALDVFRRMETQLTGWEEDEGKEILYLFIGREEHLLKHDDEAAKAYAEALRINPNYARARIGLGNIHYERAKKISPEALLESGVLAQAIAEYRRAIAIAPRSPGAFVEVRSHLALALPLRLRGEVQLVRGDLDAAETSLSEATAEVQKAIALTGKGAGQEQYLASAYLILGAALHQRAHIRLVRGDIEDSKTQFQQASAAYLQCVQYATPLPLKRGGDLKPTCFDQNKAVVPAACSSPTPSAPTPIVITVPVPVTVVTTPTPPQVTVQPTVISVIRSATPTAPKVTVPVVIPPKITVVPTVPKITVMPTMSPPKITVQSTVQPTMLPIMTPTPPIVVAAPTFSGPTRTPTPALAPEDCLPYNPAKLNTVNEGVRRAGC